MPVQIICPTCGTKETVPDSSVGKEIQCPKCQTLLVPLTPDKMDNFAAKVLFASQVQSEEIIRQEADGPEVPFICPFCGEAYEVSAELAGKKISCRNCREPCKVDAPGKKKRRKRKSKISWSLLLAGICVCVFFFLAGFFCGRLTRF